MQELRSAYASLDPANLTAIALVLAGLALTHLVLSWSVKHKARRETATPPTTTLTAMTVRHWIWRAAARCIRPLAVLIWVNGLHFVITALMADLNGYEFAPSAIAAVDWLQGIGTVIALTWLLTRIGVTIDQALRSAARHPRHEAGEILLPFAGRAVRWVLPLIAIMLGAPALAVSPQAESIVRHAISIMVIGTLAFIALQLIQVISSLVLRRQQLSVSDNRRARAIYTQVTLLRRIVTSIVALVAIASMLMVFESVRHFGAAIIASAGVAGIILGFAAQKSIATVLAGMQIALTQPIRIDDAVIVEGEWGNIEEITLTYVVVRLWDLRRMVLPISYFIDKPFQNWTRTSTELIGSVFLYVDYSVPLERLRAELQKILDHSKLWDRKTAVLQVTDTKQHTIEIRVLASARDAGMAFDLRCEVREKLISYLQKHHPESLPQLRATFQEAVSNKIAAVNS